MKNKIYDLAGCAGGLGGISSGGFEKEEELNGLTFASLAFAIQLPRRATPGGWLMMMMMGRRVLKILGSIALGTQHNPNFQVQQMIWMLSLKFRVFRKCRPVITRQSESGRQLPEWLRMNMIGRKLENVKKRYEMKLATKTICLTGPWVKSP